MIDDHLNQVRLVMVGADTIPRPRSLCFAVVSVFPAYFPVTGSTVDVR